MKKNNEIKYPDYYAHKELSERLTAHLNSDITEGSINYYYEFLKNEVGAQIESKKKLAGAAILNENVDKEISELKEQYAKIEQEHEKKLAEFKDSSEKWAWNECDKELMKVYNAADTTELMLACAISKWFEQFGFDSKELSTDFLYYCVNQTTGLKVVKGRKLIEGVFKNEINRVKSRTKTDSLQTLYGILEHQGIMNGAIKARELDPMVAQCVQYVFAEREAKLAAKKAKKNNK